MTVVSDSTALIILLDLQRTDLLGNLFEKVYIPPKVYEEITYQEKIELPDFMEVCEIANRKRVNELLFLLDEGESEAIALALEKNLPLIIDEKKGRKIAKNLHITIFGLLGIVYLNIKKGFMNIEEAEAFLEMAKKSGYRIADNLIEQMFANI